MTVILYDADGHVIFTTTDDSLSKSKVAIAEAEIPSGYYVESVNPETGEPVLKETPKTEEEKRLEGMQAQIDATMLALTEVYETLA